MLVKISRKLTDAVIVKIGAMRQRALGLYPETSVTLADPEDEMYKFILDAAVKAAWGEHLVLKDLTPSAWLPVVRNVDFYYGAGDSRLHYRLLCVNETQAKFPPKCETFPDIYATESIPRLDEEVRSITSNAGRRAEIRAQYDAIEAQVIGFLNSHSSLNAALKIHPEIAMYVSQEYIDRVNAKAPKHATASDDPPRAVEIDIDAITSAAIAHRLATGA